MCLYHCNEYDLHSHNCISQGSTQKIIEVGRNLLQSEEDMKHGGGEEECSVSQHNVEDRLQC